MATQIRRFSLVVLAALFVCSALGSAASASPGRSASARPRQLLGHLPGAALTFAVQGDAGYLGFSHELVVLDLADRAHPRWVADLPLPTTAIAVQGSHAYVVGRGGFTVLDLSDPWRPAPVATLPTEATPGAVTAAGHRVYFAIFERLYGVDVTEPAAPKLLGSVRLSARVQSIAVRGTFAYVAASDGLHVVDVADGRALRAVAALPTADWAHSVAIVEERAFFAAGGQVLVVDIAAPARPTTVAQVDAPGGIGRMAIVGGTAYFADAQARLRAMNLASSATLPAKDTAPGVLPEKVLVQDGYVYVVDSGQGLRIFDIGQQGQPREVGQYAALGLVADLAVDGQRAFVISGWNADLHAVDAREPGRLHQAGRRLVAGPVHDLAIHDGRVYVVDDAGLRILDVATAGQERQVGALGLAYLTHVTVAGDLAYLTDARGQLWAVDVREPTAPQVVDQMAQPRAGGHITPAEGRAGMHMRDAGGVLLMAVDQGGALGRSGLYAMARAPNAVIVDRNHLFVAAGQDGVHIVDVADPAQPALLAVVDTPGHAHDVAVWGDALLVADGEGGLVWLDVANPTAPVRIDSYATPDCARAVSVAGGVAYVADRFGGLLVLALE